MPAQRAMRHTTFRRIRMPSFLHHRLGLIATLVCASLPGIASAQPAYARVLQSTPIYEQVAVPHENCKEFMQQIRCETSTRYEDRIAGYHVVYEYQGQQYAQRMAYDPGQRVAVQPPSSGSYSSSSASTPPYAVVPGQQSYSSTPPGAATVDSIQYQPNNADVPYNLDIHMGRPPHKR